MPKAPYYNQDNDTQVDNYDQKSDMSDAKGEKNMKVSNKDGVNVDTDSLKKDMIKLDESNSACVLDEQDPSFDDDSGY